MSTQETQDTPMPEASTQEDSALPDQAETYDLAKSRLRVLPGSSETAASFEFIDEDHTLGNALRYMIMKKYVSTRSSVRLSSLLLYRNCVVTVLKMQLNHVILVVHR
jgi:hypothetical protein